VKNTTQPDRPQMPIWRTRIVCWRTTDTNTHSEYVILIAVPRQKCLHERASMFCLYRIYTPPVHFNVNFCTVSKFIYCKLGPFRLTFSCIILEQALGQATNFPLIWSSHILHILTQARLDTEASFN